MRHAIAANDPAPPVPRPEHAALAVFADLSALAEIGGRCDDYAAPLAMVRAEIALRRVRDARREAT